MLDEAVRDVHPTPRATTMPFNILNDLPGLSPLLKFDSRLGSISSDLGKVRVQRFPHRQARGATEADSRNPRSFDPPFGRMRGRLRHQTQYEGSDSERGNEI